MIPMYLLSMLLAILQKGKPMAVGGIGMICTANCKSPSPA